MSGADAGKVVLRCHHCGREVSETTHTRSSYQVDYYLLHTGEVEPVTIQRTDDPASAITALKLLRVTTVVTCADCYRQPQVRQERELLFRPELDADAPPEMASTVE
jgi:hypothetical protein